MKLPFWCYSLMVNDCKNLLFVFGIILSLAAVQVRADVTVGGQVQTTISSASERSVGDERAIKAGVMSGLLFAQDDIDGFLSGLSNSAVREPLGAVDLSYRRSRWTESIGSDYSDAMFGSLTIPVGDQFGMTLIGDRSQSTEGYALSNYGANVFWKNPKDGSPYLGFHREHSHLIGGDTDNTDYIDIGYQWLNPEAGYWRVAYRKATGDYSGNIKRVGGGLYQPKWSLAGSGQWSRTRHGSIEYGGNSKWITAKYEGDKATLTGRRGRYFHPTSGVVNSSIIGVDYYPQDNLALSLSHWGMRHGGYEVYKVKYQPPSNKFQVGLILTDLDSPSDGLAPLFFNLTLSVNLGRKRTLKAADRDRDPY